MSNKLDNLKQVNASLIKKIKDLETMLFIENIEDMDYYIGEKNSENGNGIEFELK